jgi:hypothetical protein
MTSQKVRKPLKGTFREIHLLKLSSGLQVLQNALSEDIYVVREIGSISTHILGKIKIH